MPHDDVIAAVIRLRPQIAAARATVEATHRLPSPLVEALAAAQLFQLHLPRALGGPECSPLTAFAAIEALATADGAVGWVAMLATALSYTAAWLPPEVGRTLFGTPPDCRLAGSYRPAGQAIPVSGGYRVTGQWDFASGITHARWLLCTCTLIDGATPLRGAAGQPVTRTLLVPATDATLVDTWDVLGLGGTGSQDFRVHNVFVPTAHTLSLSDSPPPPASPMYAPRFLFVVTWTSTVATALGIARGALDTLIALAAHTGSKSAATLLCERPLVQTAVAEAEAILQAARAYVLDAVGTFWHTVEAGAADPRRPLAQARLAITHGMHEAVRAVDRVFQAAGTNAIYRRHGLEQAFRDVHTAVQHAAGLPIHLEHAGQVLLGLSPNAPGW